MPNIEVQDFSYSYPGMEAYALQNIDLAIDAGEIVCLIGLNGSGKSTFCLSLSSLIPHLFNGKMEGVIRIFSADTRTHEPGEFAGKVGLVIQNPLNQLSRMRYTVFEEVAFGLENLGVPRGEMPGRITRALQQVGLEDLEERSPYTLSGGQQQRLALASVLVMDTPILILDEPTGMLDPHASLAFYQIMYNLATSGKTIIISDQKLDKIADFATRVILLSEGKILLDGAPRAVLTSPILTQAGIEPILFTQAAKIGINRGLWPPGRALPINVKEAETGFLSSINNSYQE